MLPRLWCPSPKIVKVLIYHFDLAFIAENEILWAVDQPNCIAIDVSFRLGTLS